MILDKHAPMKKKVRDNEAPFMAKELRKAIMNLRIDIKNERFVKTSWHLRSRRIFVRILTKRQRRTTFLKLLQME